MDELRERLDALEPGKPVYVICQSGLRSYIACRILAGYGYDCYNFSGGFRFYDAVTHDRCLVERAADCGMDRYKNSTHCNSGCCFYMSQSALSFFSSVIVIVPRASLTIPSLWK